MREGPFPKSWSGTWSTSLSKSSARAGIKSGLTVSPAGKTILYTKVVSESYDLMLIENFR